MRKMTAIFLTMALAATACAAAKKKDEEPAPRPFGQCTARPTGEGWIDLFDKDNAPAWKEPSGKEFFTMKDGVMHIAGSKPTKYASYMTEQFDDFQLHVEFKLTEKCNSGVLMRAKPEDPPYTGFEIQIYDDHGGLPSFNSGGSMYDIAAPMYTMTRPTGEWNSYDITAKGKHVVVFMNGWKILDVDFSKMTMPIGKFKVPYAQMPSKGHIVLQDHGHELWFRNAMIKKLGK
jgi:3-keto-disaccharide hydrolase